MIHFCFLKTFPNVVKSEIKYLGELCGYGLLSFNVICRSLPKIEAEKEKE